MSKLVDPDFWVTLGNKLLDPDSIPLIALLLIALYVGRKTKSRVDDTKIKGMEAQINAANQRFLLAKEQRAAGGDVERV